MYSYDPVIKSKVVQCENEKELSKEVLKYEEECGVDKSAYTTDPYVYVDLNWRG